MAKEKTNTDPQREKDSHSGHNHAVDGLSDDLTGFYNGLLVLFPSLRITSGKRDFSPSGESSHHHKGDAIDIGKENADVYEYLYNTQEGLTLMNKYKLGILDETDPEALKKSKGTGPHFHIGKDSALYKKVQTRFNNFDNTQPVHAFINQNPTYDYSKPQKGQTINRNRIKNVANTGLMTIPVGPTGLGGEVVVPADQASMLFIEQVKKEEEKVEINKKKDKESDARKQLKKVQDEKSKRQQDFLKTLGAAHERDEALYKKRKQNLGRRQTKQINPLEGIDIQTALPKLPSIFKYQ